MWNRIKEIGGVIVMFITIIGGTSAFWIFIHYDKLKIEYDSKIETLQVKNIALHDDRGKLEKENAKLYSWLRETPKTIPYFERVIKEKEATIDSLRLLLEKPTTSKTTETNNKSHKKKYRYSEKLKEGESFIDPLTNSTVSIYKIEMDYSAKAKVDYPNGFNTTKVKSESIDVSPGFTWTDVRFENRQFKIVIQKIDPLFDEFVIEIIEN
ncbi:hypothetical protein [Marinigracilibium pacificum]|uniref:Uncharacterized protein n=1 Tax=Marinigracilibium pacificum TaxID=2729599 RepID=A0A848J8L0_9BACT|nr:hypothetical protein [Marinigracilibium pacificum]NMM50764.1 hypothetical protein [Marinigracilibium pacificum]